MPTITEQYTAAFPKAQAHFAEAKRIFPNGVTHDARGMEPFPPFIERALGSHKWDIDGHEFIDYWSGHGSLILGHSHPAVVQAVQDQMAKSTHAGGNHDLEIEWAKWVLKLVPSAEKVRFTGSGTEATLMAIRLARLFTNKSKILKFSGHFHGWHDGVTIASDPPYDTHSVPGVPAGTAANTLAISPNNIELLEETLMKDRDIAAVILEPTGGHWGAVPIRGEFLKALREITAKQGVLLIFDEVITGFRVAPGGAQEFYGIKPDLTTLAKILAGGLPGGCLTGRADILDGIAIRPGKPRMRHPGTYNGNPLSASAGIACLSRIADGKACKQANEMAKLLRNECNAMFAKRGFPWISYIDFSMFRFLPNYDGPSAPVAENDNDGLIPYGGDLNKLDGPRDPKIVSLFRQGMLLHGVDLSGLGGWLTAAHTPADVMKTVTAVEKTVEAMG